MTPISSRWTLVLSLAILAASPIGVRCLRAEPPTSTSQPSSSAPDLSDPKKTYETAMTALMHNASVTYKACIYFPDKADGPLVDALITEQIAKHQLGQAAVAKFGDDGNGLVNEPQNSDESLQKALDKMKNGIVETKGEWAVLRENAERFGSSANFRKVDGLWKIDHSRYVAFLAKDREHNQAGMVANARVMEELTQQIKAGAFKDVEEAKATLALKKIAASSTPATAPAATATPSDRWLKKAAQPGLSDLQRVAYEQLAQVYLANLQQTGIPGSYDMNMPNSGSPKAVGNLYAMGLDVVPILAEALDDTTMTNTVTRHGSGRKIEHRVNEMVARLIQSICGRNFVVGEDPHQVTLESVGTKPELAPQFQKVISEWFKVNRKRNEVERKLADVEDNWFRNRLDAVEWLARKKEAKGVPAIVKYIDRTFVAMEKEESSLKVSELSECAVALGQIGDKMSLPSVKSVCQRLSANWDKRHRPLGSMEIGDLFQAYQGMALLGDKKAAVDELTRIYDAYSGEMEAMSSQEFKERLDKAAKW